MIANHIGKRRIERADVGVTHWRFKPERSNKSIHAKHCTRRLSFAEQMKRRRFRSQGVAIMRIDRHAFVARFEHGRWAKSL